LSKARGIGVKQIRVNVEAQNQSKEDIGILDEFQRDFVEFWGRLPNKFFFGALLLMWLALFQFLGNSTFGYIDTPSLFRWMMGAYTSPSGDDGHGFLVPLVVLGLFWWKQKELVALPLKTWWPGLVLVVLAVLLHVGSYVAQWPQTSIVAFFIGLYGLMGVAWGFRFLRASFFPFFLFVFCVPLGGQGQIITMPLRQLVARIVTLIARAGIAPDLIREGTQLTDAAHTFSYDIAPACSGIRSLVTLLALTTIYGCLSFKPAWKRAVMVVSAFPLAVIGNVVRITFTVAVAELLGQDAGKKVEQNFGFVTFAVAIVCVILLGKWLRDPEPESASEVKAA
jgi:exosortase